MVDLTVSGPIEGPSRWLTSLARGGPRLWWGGALVGILFLVALLAPLLAPHDPIDQDLLSAQLPPAWMQGGELTYPLGTDSLGRCVVSRLMFAATAGGGRALSAGF